MITFLALTFALSSVFYFLIIKAGHLRAGHGLYSLGLMWCPGVSGIITRLLFKQNTSPMGWRWGKTRYQAAAVLIPIGYATIAYLAVWTFKLGGFYNDKIISQMPVGIAAHPEWQAIPLYLILLVTSGCIKTLGEEIGWRGFLVPQLARSNSFHRTAVISGLIWSLWHYPILIFADYNSGTPAWYGLSCFTVSVVSVSVILAWLRLKSGSLWTCVFLHATHDAFVQGFFDPVTRDTGYTKYIIGEFGIALALVSMASALYFWKRGNVLPNVGNNSPA